MNGGRLLHLLPHSQKLLAGVERGLARGGQRTWVPNLLSVPGGSQASASPFLGLKPPDFRGEAERTPSLSVALSRPAGQ